MKKLTLEQLKSELNYLAKEANFINNVHATCAKKNKITTRNSQQIRNEEGCKVDNEKNRLKVIGLIKSYQHEIKKHAKKLNNVTFLK